MARPTRYTEPLAILSAAVHPELKRLVIERAEAAQTSRSRIVEQALSLVLGFDPHSQKSGDKRLSGQAKRRPAQR